MTQVSFYTGVPERLAYLCRLLRKAQQSGARIGVCGPVNLLMRLDAALWTFEDIEFVPHLRLARGAALAPGLADTPILLVERSEDLPHRELLLNLDLGMPAGFDEFQRVLEVVSQDPPQMEAGRQRFRQYKELGHEVTHHVVTA
jgi:DNA polymerase-3 subunit chi